MDPVALTVLSAVGGAGVTAIAGFIGAQVQSRREHHKWVREQRYAAYLAYVHADDRYRAVRQDMAAKESAFEAVREWIAAHDASPEVWPEAPHELQEVGMTHEEREARLVALRERLEAAQAGIVEAAGAFSILGPSAVIEAAHILIRSEPIERNRAMAALETEMRKALGIKL